ncbi:glycerophosphodiester phosphodiesterase [soil metagenome]
MTSRHPVPDIGRAGPLIIAHRGASGYRPEHTSGAYELAMDLGADIIEPDVVATADGMLVCRHENELSATTDIASHPEFARRMTTKWVEGVEQTGWFTEDFTMAELRTLRGRERFPDIRPSSAARNDTHALMSLDELVFLVERSNARNGTHTGICIEFKSPAYFRRLGLPLDQLLSDTIARNPTAFASTAIMIEAEDQSWLRALRHRVTFPLIQLIDRHSLHLASREGLRNIATYASGIAPHKHLVVGLDAEGRLDSETGLVAAAHAQALTVIVWTLRNENRFLPAQMHSSAEDRDYGHAASEYTAYLDAGVDALFSDFPDTAVRAREEWLRSANANATRR